MATDDDDHDDMTMVMVLILVMVMVIYSIHSEYRNYMNVYFRLRISPGRATTIAAPMDFSLMHSPSRKKTFHNSNGFFDIQSVAL